MLLQYRVDQLEEKHFMRLVEEGVPEGRHIDYKQELPAKNDLAKYEFRKDLISFANGGGGDIIFGMKEDDGVASELCGLSSLNLEDDRIWLEQLGETHIDPPIFGYRVQRIKIGESTEVVLVRIPRSYVGPHAVLKNQRPEFFIRNSDRKRPMTVSEIKRESVVAQSYGERVREFRSDRIKQILNGDTPAPMESPRCLLLQIVPLEAIVSPFQLSLDDVFAQHRCGKWFPMGEPFSGYRINLDGLLTYSTLGESQFCQTYLQVFRNGIVEAVDLEAMEPHSMKPNGPSLVNDKMLVHRVVVTTKNVFEAYESLGVSPPLIVSVSLVGVRDLCLPREKIQSRLPLRFDRDQVLLPEVQIEDYGTPVHELLRPVFDLLWNAAGAMACPHYSDSGQLDL